MPLTPEQIAQQLVCPITDTATGHTVGVAYGQERILTRWTPAQADELEAVGRLMIALADDLRAAASQGAE